MTYDWRNDPMLQNGGVAPSGHNAAADEIARLRAENERLSRLADAALMAADEMKRTADERATQAEAQAAAMVGALEKCVGYLLNAKIDLETGAPKRTAIQTIEGGLKMVREHLTAYHAEPVALSGQETGMEKRT